MTKEQIIKNGFRFNLFGQKNVVVTMGTGIPSDMQKNYGSRKVGKWIIFKRDGNVIFRMEQVNKNNIEIAIPARDGYTITNGFNPNGNDEDLDTTIKMIITEQANLNGSEYDKYLTDYYVGIKLLHEFNEAKKYLDRWVFIWQHNKMLRTITKSADGILSPKQKQLLNK
jgi:hypothetical protein